MRNIALVVVLFALFIFVGSSMSATYTIQAGDSWYRVAKKISETSGIKHDPQILQELQPSDLKFISGQKIRYLGKEDVANAKKWIELCVRACYTDALYAEDYENLKARIIKKSAIRRYLNFAEAYNLGVRPAAVATK